MIAHLWRLEAVYRNWESQQYISMSSFLVPVPPFTTQMDKRSSRPQKPLHWAFVFFTNKAAEVRYVSTITSGHLFRIPALVTIIHSNSTARSCLRLYAIQPAPGSSPSQPPLRTLHCLLSQRVIRTRLRNHLTSLGCTFFFLCVIPLAALSKYMGH